MWLTPNYPVQTLLALRPPGLFAHGIDRAHVGLELTQRLGESRERLGRLGALVVAAEEHAEARRLGTALGNQVEARGGNRAAGLGEVALEVFALPRIRDHELNGVARGGARRHQLAARGRADGERIGRWRGFRDLRRRGAHGPGRPG